MKELEILNKHKILNLSELDDYTIDMYDVYYENTEGTTDELTYDEFITLKEWQDGNQTIDQANPSEALKCLNFLKNESINDIACLKNSVTTKTLYQLYFANFDTIKQALLKVQDINFNYNKIVIPFLNELGITLGINDIDEMLDKVKEQEKVLKIIKEKDVNIGLVKVLGSVGQYNQTYIYDNMRNVKWCLTEEEFDLLKRCLECQKD